MAYMEIFGNCSTNNSNEFLRYSVPAYNLSQTSEQISTHSFTSSITHSQTMSLTSPQHHKPAIPSPLASPNPTGKPPALPPKSIRTNSISYRAVPTPPSSPKPNSISPSGACPSPVLKISPVRISTSSFGSDRDGYEHLCDATSQSSPNLTTNPSQSISPNNHNLNVTNNISPSTTKVIINDNVNNGEENNRIPDEDDDQPVVLRRNNRREKVLIFFN